MGVRASGALDFKDAATVIYHCGRLRQRTAGSGDDARVGLGANELARFGFGDLVSLGARSTAPAPLRHAGKARWLRTPRFVATF